RCGNSTRKPMLSPKACPPPTCSSYRPKLIMMRFDACPRHGAAGLIRTTFPLMISALPSSRYNRSISIARFDFETTAGARVAVIVFPLVRDSHSELYFAPMIFGVNFLMRIRSIALCFLLLLSMLYLHAADDLKPLFKDFMGVNGHTVQFKPELYKSV